MKIKISKKSHRALLGNFLMGFIYKAGAGVAALVFMWLQRRYGG